MEELTIEKLKEMNPGIFKTGVTRDDTIERGTKLKWVAVRGGIHDWAIYYDKAEMSDEYVRDRGDKFTNKDTIRQLVPCDEEAFDMYRY